MIALLLSSATVAQAQAVDCNPGSRPTLRHNLDQSSCVHAIDIGTTGAQFTVQVAVLLDGDQQHEFSRTAAAVGHFAIQPSVPGLSVTRLDLGTDPDAPEGAPNKLLVAVLTLALDRDVTQDTTFRIDVDPAAFAVPPASDLSTSSMTLLATRALSLGPDSVSVQEGDGGTKNLTFTVTLDKIEPRHGITVDYGH